MRSYQHPYSIIINNSEEQLKLETSFTALNTLTPACSFVTCHIWAYLRLMRTRFERGLEQSRFESIML